MLLFAAAISLVSGSLSIAGQIQSILGVCLFARFCHFSKSTKASNQLHTPSKHPSLPGLSVLKPLHGDEPLLKEALESFFQQDYPDYELIFGVHDRNDPALNIIEKLRSRYPHQKIAVVVDSTEHGPNRKIGNLINMQHKCRYDTYVISDSDIHVQPDYLRHIATTLQAKGTQLVTTLYAGLPASQTLVRLLGAHSINANFLPGVMMSRFLNRQDCLGATMALTQENLARIGGFSALVHHIADDSELGRRIRQQGGKISLASTICLTTVTEKKLNDLLHHEIRWGRTVRSIEPVGYALSVIQLPLFWATLCVAFSPLSYVAWSLFIGNWLLRGIITRSIAHLTECPLPGIFPYLVLRDWLSAIVMMMSASGSRVAWRGRTVHITRNKTRTSSHHYPLHTLNSSSPTMNRSGVDKSDLNRSIRS